MFAVRAYPTGDINPLIATEYKFVCPDCEKEQTFMSISMVFCSNCYSTLPDLSYMVKHKIDRLRYHIRGN